MRQEIGADEDVEKWYEVTFPFLAGIGLDVLVRGRYNGSPQLFLESNMPKEE